ncbi:DEAD-box ATP-dependent RNA helicase 13-like [Glycine soja]|uniref:DEAD-box ATP-dependent RNA helicase 13-like n=1 Tax=Glycine soja TaxID=3848 RepID=UPI00103E58B5|nr:DEAD-box ATP-dependent RNA helicase 13-like [Glycine soja]
MSIVCVYFVSPFIGHGTQILEIAMDRFRENENGILVATDVAARGLDILGVRTIVHYRLPHSAEVYVHRSGRIARASAEGCCIALISSRDTSKFASLCKSFSKDNFQWFPLENSYVPEVLKRLSLARQIDKITRNESQVY